MRIHGHAIASIGVVLVSFAVSVAARADIVIIGSNSPALAIGMVLSDVQTLEVPDGSSVRVMSPSGRTQVFKGPLKKSVKEVADKGPADATLWKTVTARNAALSVNAERPRTGATRGMTAAAPSPAAAYKFSWQQVPVFADGDICVEKGATLLLVRAGPGKQERVAVVDMLGGKRSEVMFADGRTQAPWPSDLEARVGGFAFQAEGQPARQIKLRLIAPLPSAEDAVRVLNGQRCDIQRNALLDALKDPNFQVSALVQP